MTLFQVERMNNNIKKNVVYQTIYRVLTVLTPLITSPILSRALGADKLGIYSATITWVNYFMLLALLGIENYGSRSIAIVQDNDEKRKQTFWDIYAIQIISSLLALGLYAVSLLFIAPERHAITIIHGLWLISYIINVNWYFIGIEEFRLTAIRNIITKVLAVVLIVLLIHKPDDLNLYARIMAGDAVLTNLIILPFLFRDTGFRKPSLDGMKKHIKPILILFVPIIAWSIFHLADKSLLDRFATETQSGYYYNADKIINIPLAVVTGLNTVFLPRISHVYSKGDRKEAGRLIGNSIELMLFMACAIGIGIASVSKEFVPFFFGEGYEPVTELIYWFTPVLFCNSLSELIRYQYMIPKKLDKHYNLCVVIAAVCAVIADFLLIPRLGPVGAVMGTLIGEATIVVVELIVCHGHISFLGYLGKNIIYFILAAAMFATVRATASILNIRPLFKIAIMIMAGGAVYMIGCIIYWCINRQSLFNEQVIRRVQRMFFNK